VGSLKVRGGPQLGGKRIKGGGGLVRAMQKGNRFPIGIAEVIYRLRLKGGDLKEWQREEKGGKNSNGSSRITGLRWVGEKATIRFRKENKSARRKKWALLASSSSGM